MSKIVTLAAGGWFHAVTVLLTVFFALTHVSSSIKPFSKQEPHAHIVNAGFSTVKDFRLCG